MVSIDHFGRELGAQISRAATGGAPDGLINSPDPCGSIPKGNHAAESCCGAMQGEMKAGDILLNERTVPITLYVPAISPATGTT
jgi:hypothetical protein